MSAEADYHICKAGTCAHSQWIEFSMAPPINRWLMGKGRLPETEHLPVQQSLDDAVPSLGRTPQHYTKRLISATTFEENATLFPQSVTEFEIDRHFCHSLEIAPGY
jgi:hypothetical protein